MCTNECVCVCICVCAYMQLCLDFINAVVCYSSLPSECLVDIVTTLCQMLNIEKMAKQCLEVSLDSHSTLIHSRAQQCRKKKLYNIFLVKYTCQC